MPPADYHRNHPFAYLSSHALTTTTWSTTPRRPKTLTTTATSTSRSLKALATAATTTARSHKLLEHTIKAAKTPRLNSIKAAAKWPLKSFESTLCRRLHREALTSILQPQRHRGLSFTPSSVRPRWQDVGFSVRKHSLHRKQSFLDITVTPAPWDTAIMIAILDVKALPPHLKPYVREGEVRKVKWAVFCLSATDFASMARRSITYDSSTNEGQAWARACHLCLLLEKPCLVEGEAQKKKKGKAKQKEGDTDGTGDYTCGPCMDAHRGCSLFVLNRKGATLDSNIFLTSFLSGVCPQDSLYTTHLSYAQLGSHFEAIQQGKKVTQSAQDKVEKAQLAAAPLGLASMVSSSSAGGYVPTPSRPIQVPPSARYEHPTIVPLYVPPSIPGATLPADQRTW